MPHPALSPALRLPLAVTALLATVAWTVLAVAFAGDTGTDGVDGSLRATLAATLPGRGRFALAVDLVGEPVVMVVLAAVLAAACAVLGRRRLAVVAVAGIGTTGVATTALKPLVGRTIHEGFLSYPSGHTAAATAFALVLGLLVADLLRAPALPALLLVLGAATVSAAVMAWAQVTLEAHYPTDTLGGFCTALVTVPATAAAVDLLARRSPPP